MSKFEPMIVEQSYWDESYSQLKFARVPGSDSTRQMIRRVVPQAKPGQTAFEIGCFPGRYLVELGSLGYIVSGCDMTARVELDMKPWLESQGCQVGQLFRGDYREVARGRFDLVSSFGFVEHFEDFRSVVEFQVSLVKPGGLAVVQFPNFHGVIQRTLRQIVDRDNLANHVLDAMNLDNYLGWIGGLGNLLVAEYYGNFDFWTDDYLNRNGRARNNIIRALNRTRRLWAKMPNSRHWSPYAVMVIRVPV